MVPNLLGTLAPESIVSNFLGTLALVRLEENVDMCPKKDLESDYTRSGEGDGSSLSSTNLIILDPDEGKCILEAAKRRRHS